MQKPSDRVRRVLGVVALLGCVAVQGAAAAPAPSTDAARGSVATFRDRDRESPVTPLAKVRRLIIRALQEITIPKP